ncbi:hypothetical protein [Parasphingorhabdus sp. NYA22]
MNERLDIDSIREYINQKILDSGRSRRSISIGAGLTSTAIKDLMQRTEDPGIVRMFKITQELGIPFEEFIRNVTVGAKSGLR